MNSKELDEVLVKHAEPQYKKFTAGLVNPPSQVLGVRAPVLRGIVKEIAKGDVISFLDNTGVDNYEKAVIYGLLITKLKDEEVAFKYFGKFVTTIDNWAVCDSVCLDFYTLERCREKRWEYVKNLAESKSEFISRAGIVLMLKFYKTEQFTEKVFAVMDGIRSDAYYVNMAQAWLIAEYFIASRDKTLAYLRSNKLNAFTHNKAIQKIRESLRVSAGDKETLILLKRKARRH